MAGRALGSPIHRSTLQAAGPAAETRMPALNRGPLGPIHEASGWPRGRQPARPDLGSWEFEQRREGARCLGPGSGGCWREAGGGLFLNFLLGMSVNRPSEGSRCGWTKEPWPRADLAPWYPRVTAQENSVQPANQLATLTHWCQGWDLRIVWLSQIPGPQGSPGTGWHQHQRPGPG